MAVAVCRNISGSDALMNITSDSAINTCMNCVNTEKLLKEALDELTSAQTINKLLQKELLVANACKQGKDSHDNEGYSAPTDFRKWSVVTTKTHTGKTTQKHNITSATKSGNLIATSNGYLPLTKVPDDDKYSIPVIVNGNISMRNRAKTYQHGTQSIPMENSEKYRVRCDTKLINHQKIIILGDSHARGLAANIKHILGNKSTITGYVSPGAECSTISNPAIIEPSELTKKDKLIIWSGSNDIARNESNKGLACLSTLAQRFENTNIIVVNAPKRHDLLQTSCVNVEVDNFNCKLQKRMKVFNHVKILSANLERKYFTQHGMHLNAAGKERAARGLARVISSFRKSEMTAPISLCRKDDQVTPTTSYDIQECLSPDCKNDDSQKSEVDDVSRNGDDPQEEETTRRSSRVKKPPTNKYRDFLCQTKSMNYTV
jgi:hypothetical protein